MIKRRKRRSETKAEKVRQKLREILPNRGNLNYAEFMEDYGHILGKETLRGSQFYQLRKQVLMEVENNGGATPSISAIHKLARLAGEITDLMEKEGILVVTFRRENTDGEIMARPKMEVKEAPKLQIIDL